MKIKQSLYKKTLVVSILFSLLIFLTATVAVAASVTFRWDPTVSPHDGYKVFARKAGQAYNYSQPNWQGAATTCTINNLLNQTEYYFVARAYKGSLDSANSNEVHYVPGGTTTGGTTTGGTTSGQQPYGGKLWPVPGTIEAEDYDTGGEGAAYHDTSAGNKGGKYRNDAVDIWYSGSIGHYTGANTTGEWLEYTVNVATSGTYSLDLNVATPTSGRKMRVRLDGKDVTGSISVPNTGGWNNWETVMTTVQLSAGKHVLRVEFVLGGLNFNWMDISPIGSTKSGTTSGGTTTGGTTSGGSTTSGTTSGQQPYRGKLWPVPGTIEAENYDTGGEGAAYHDTSAGNKGGKYRNDAVDIWYSGSIGHYTGANTTGEWLEYTVNVATSGTYSLDLNVATPTSGRKMRVRLDGKDVTGSISVPNTGGWNNWETVMTTVQLSAGKHVLRVEFVLGGLNFNWMDIGPIGSTKSGTTTGGTTTGGTTSGQQPYGGTPWRLPGTIEAEDYDMGGEGSAYHDTNAANKGGQYRTDGVDIWKSSYKDYYTGGNNTGEWLEYTVNVAYAGSYKLDLRVAAPKSGGKLRVKLDGVYVTGPISVPNTGAWNVWRTVRATANLKAGKHVLRVEVIQGGFNLDWIDIF